MTNMKLHLLIASLLIILNVVHADINYNNVIRLIVDVVKLYNRPTAVIAFVCWKLQYKVDLTNLLRNVSDPKMIKFIHETKSFDFSPKDALIVVDASCPYTRDLFRKANDKKMFTNICRWLIVGQPLNKRFLVPPELEEFQILTDSEVIITQNGNDSNYDLFMIFKNNVKSEWLIEDFGTWTSAYGFRKSKLMDASVMRRKNLSKQPIRISFAIADNRTKYELTDVRNSIDALTKSSYRQTESLFDFINATRVIVYTDTWGYLINGTWNGMVGNIVRGEAELAGTVHFLTPSRIQVLHFLTSPMDIKLFFVFREPPLSYTNNLFLLPFKASVWWCTAGFVLILMLFLYINAQWEERKFNNMDSSHCALRPKVSDVVMMIISAISQQGSFTELKGTIGRFVMFILFFAFLFLYTSYAAYVVALLQTSSKQIRTLSDLLNSKLELGVEDTPYNRHYFTTATDPVRKAIYETKVAPRGSKPKFMNLDEGVRKLQKNPFAFHMNTGPGYRVVERYFYEHEKCGLQEIAYTLPTKPWLSCSKDSPYKDIFKIGLLRSIEHGLSDRQYRLMFSRKPLCSTHGGSFASVSIIDVYPAMLMLLYGMFIALSLLVVEILVHRKLQGHRNIIDDTHDTSFY